MEIKVLGSGCKNCKRLLDNTKIALTQLKIDVDVMYISDLGEISRLGVMRTPALVINNTIVSLGRVLTVEEVTKQLLKFQALTK